MYCKGLTKQELQDAGIMNVYYNNSTNAWEIIRYWYKNNCKTKDFTKVSITMARGKHKYRPDKYYPKVTFCVKQKRHNIPLSRLIYVWFKGDIPDGYVVDHIDNNSLNNDPTNLQILTIEENLAKRFEDDPAAWTNQWGKPKGWIKE